MSSQQILPVPRSGGWSGFHRIYYNAAIRSLNHIDPRRNELADLFRQLTAEGGEKFLSEYQVKLEEYLTLANTIQIYCAMSVEALLNLYGVLRLSEAFYKRSIERVGIVPKLEILLATCDNHLLPKDAEITAILRRLSEARNALVHPKSREHRTDDISASGFGNLPKLVKQSVDDMKRFFELFSDISAETKATVQMFGFAA